MNFQTLSYYNKNTVMEYFGKENSKTVDTSSNITCDLVFGTTFLWREYYNTRFALIDEALILQTQIGGTDMFSVPIGSDDISRSLRALKDFSQYSGIALYFSFVPESYLPYFRETFDVVFESEEPDWSDYVFDLESLRDFPGRSYHGQKNHLNKFKKTNPDASFHIIGEDNKGSVSDFTSLWYKQFSDGSSMSAAEEQAAYDYMNNMDSNSHLVGGYITAGGQIKGFTVGEIVDDTVFIHIEKADHTVSGAYQFLQSEFLRSISGRGIRFVNREEDMGIIGLRKAKHALHPVKILKKYTLYCY